MIENLYKRYYLELLHWCQKMTTSPQAAEELVQEAFVRAMLHLELLETLNEKQCRAWLYRTTKNLYIDKVRHASFEEVVETIPESASSPQEYAELEWESVLEQLPDIEGTLFIMRYLYGYNASQLSEMFSMPPGTIRFKLSSARKHLRDMIGGK